MIYPLAVLAGAIFFAIGFHVPRGTRLVVAFLGGITLHVYRRKVPWHPGLFALVVAVAFGAAYLHMRAVVVVCSAYMTVFLGLCNPRRSKVIQGADYSYGMYLYGYVIQQALYQLLPIARTWYANAVLALIVAAAFAAFSWYCVEKPAMGLRSRVKSFEDWVLRRPGAARLLEPARR